MGTTTLDIGELGRLLGELRAAGTAYEECNGCPIEEFDAIRARLVSAERAATGALHEAAPALIGLARQAQAATTGGVYWHNEIEAWVIDVPEQGALKLSDALAAERQRREQAEAERDKAAMEVGTLLLERSRADRRADALEMRLRMAVGMLHEALSYAHAKGTRRGDSRGVDGWRDFVDAALRRAGEGA